MNDRPRAPELHAGFAWLNTDRPLTFANELRGQVVLLDFWTYCCINCMHVLPDLAYLEEKYREEPFLVIGVHSAKFTNEGQRQTVRAAVGRYEIAHPVVIDENMRLSGEYAVRPCPPLVLGGATRRVLRAVSCEGNRETPYVAATEHHMMRAVDLRSWSVSTIAGTGAQGYDRSGGKIGTQQALSSPWDLAVEGSTLYIAMAGPHQLWRLDLPMGFARAFVGSGRENIVDGPVEAPALAQPSGLALSGNYLYFADSEVSAVRRVDLAEEKVETLIGRGLFDYGDRDGDFASARLQHPLGVAVWRNRILVADTYNHKIKEIDVQGGTIKTLAGDGRPGTEREGHLALFEPGGLHAAEDVLYIADTNNHRVVRFHLVDRTSSEVVIEGLEAPELAGSGDEGNPAVLSTARLRAGESTAWRVAVKLPEGAHVSEEAPASIRVARGSEVMLQRTLLGQPWPLAFELPAQPEGAADLHVQVSFAYCNEGQGVCVPANPSWRVPVTFDLHGEASAELTASLS